MWRRAPWLLGGCRPMRLLELLGDDNWGIEHHSVVSAIGLCSEILVASPRP